MYEVITKEELYNENKRLKLEVTNLQNENLVLYESLTYMAETVEYLLELEEEKFFEALKE